MRWCCICSHTDQSKQHTYDAAVTTGCHEHACDSTATHGKTTAHMWSSSYVSHGNSTTGCTGVDGAMHREFVHASITSAPVRTVENRRADAGGHHISSAVVRTSGLRTRPQACEALERPREYAAVQSMDANDLRHASGDGTTTASGTKVQRRIGCAGERTHIVLSHPVRSSPSCARRTRLTRGGEYDPG